MYVYVRVYVCLYVCEWLCIFLNVPSLIFNMFKNCQKLRKKYFLSIEFRRLNTRSLWPYILDPHRTIFNIQCV